MQAPVVAWIIANSKRAVVRAVIEGGVTADTFTILSDAAWLSNTGLTALSSSPKLINIKVTCECTTAANPFNLTGSGGTLFMAFPTGSSYRCTELDFSSFGGVPLSSTTSSGLLVITDVLGLYHTAGQFLQLIMEFSL